MTKATDLVPTPDFELDTKERPSNPIKQGLVGLVEGFTDIPGMIGAVGSAIEGGYNTLNNDKGFGDNFFKAQEAGVDKSLQDFSHNISEGLNKIAGIDYAVSTEDQIARNVASWVVPGSLGKSAIGQVATFLSPFVRPGKGFATRAATQVGVGTGIDQGIRSLVNNYSGQEVMPLMFSDTALQGKQTEGESLSIDASTLIPTLPNENGAVQVNTLVPTNTVTPTITRADTLIPDHPLKEQQEAFEAQQDRDLAQTILIGTAIAGSLYGIKKWRDIRKLAQAPLTPTGTEPAKNVDSLKEAYNTIKAAPGIGGKYNAAEGIVNEFFAESHGNIFNQNAHIAKQLREAGISEQHVDELTGQIGAADDGASMLATWLNDGILLDGSKVSKPMRELKREFDRWEQPKQQEFIDYMSALREDMVRTRATASKILNDNSGENFPTAKIEIAALKRLSSAYKTGSSSLLERRVGDMEEFANLYNGKRVKPGLWNKDTGEMVMDPELKARIDKGTDEFRTMRNHLAEYNKAVLDSAVKRGVISKKWADAVKLQHTKANQLIYLPGMESIETGTWYQQLARAMGLTTTNGKTMERVGNLYKQNLEEKSGVMAPVNPFDASAQYVGEMIEHTNRSVVQWNIMSRLTGLRFRLDGSVEINPDFVAGRNAPQYIGRSSPEDPFHQYGRLNMEYHNEGSPLQNKFVNDVRKTDPADPGVNQPLPEQLAQIKDALVIQHKGDFYVFDTTNAGSGFKSAMEFDSQLATRMSRLNNTFKKLFTQFTTGKYSPFAPISALYNNQMGSFNAMLRAEGGLKNASAEAIAVWRDGIKGTWDIFSTKVADDYAQILAENMHNNSALYNMAPELITKIQTRLAKKARESMLAPIQRETGRFASSLNASEFSQGLTDALDKSAFHISKKFGGNALPQFVRIWDHLNAALHEGTAYAATLRKLGGTVEGKSGNQIRQARQAATDIIGDNRLKGSHMDWFNAAVPFSGAMLQAWSTLGRAMHKSSSRTVNGVTKVTKGGMAGTAGTIGLVVGMPTAIEVAYNSLLDPDATFDRIDPRTGAKQTWTYASWYWKGLSADQRNNNMVIPIPGMPPWEAALIPMVPELSLAKSMIIDGMEAMFSMAEWGSLDPNDPNATSINQTKAGFARAFSVPLPPHWKAGLSAMGIDVQAGLELDGLGDDGIPFIKSHSLPTGERVTGSNAQNKYVGSEASIRIKTMVSDLVGAAGTTSMAVYDAFNSGNDLSPPKLGERTDLALEQLGKSIVTQARWTNPFYGKLLRNTPDKDIVERVMSKKNALKEKAGLLKTTMEQGSRAGNVESLGNTVPVTDDHIAKLEGAQASIILQEMAYYDGEVSKLRRQISTLGTANVDNHGKHISIRERDDRIDTLNLEIDKLKREQLAKLKERETNTEDYIFHQTGKRIKGYTFD
jgi:hypothetical protein